MNWYVVGESANFPVNLLKKVTIWNKDYVIWKDKSDNFYAMDDDCSHNGASLSRGHLHNNCVVCPYHGYEFAGNGNLTLVPGLNFTSSPCKNQKGYTIVSRNGWIFMNTISKREYIPREIDFFQEDEANHPDYSYIVLNVLFKAYGRIVSENSLDVMHIGFVHTFGNRDFPSPLSEVPPYAVGKYENHYRTEYDYLSGKDSFAKKIFKINQLKIQNEFALPHSTVARIIFGPFVSTVVTFARPINMTHTQLYVKTYRNFWRKYTNDNNILCILYNYIGNFITQRMMYETVLQDKGVIENIKLEFLDGKFKMKYDKLLNTYRTLYKKYIHRI